MPLNGGVVGDPWYEIAAPFVAIFGGLLTVMLYIIVNNEREQGEVEQVKVGLLGLSAIITGLGIVIWIWTGVL